MSIYQGEIELSIPGKSAYEHALDGGYAGTEEEFNATLAGIENARGVVVNRNLLDNWYFANPVNQRGQTEYTGAGYSIDRWKSQNARLTVTVRDGYVNLAVSSTGRGYWRQPFENAFPIRDYTVSALVRGTGEGSFYLSDSAEKTVVTAIPFVVNSENWIMISATYGANDFIGSPYMFSIYGEANANLDVLAVKWEIGGVQTLAHQDASGNWVLNEIPDYSEQLRRCQRYFRRLPASMILLSGVATGTNTNASFVLSHSEAMRAIPSVTTSDDFSLVIYTQTGYSAAAPNTSPFGIPTQVACLSNESYGMNITATFATANVAETNNTLILVRIRTGYIDLSSDL